MPEIHSPVLQALQSLTHAGGGSRSRQRRKAAQAGFHAEGSMGLEALGLEVRGLGRLAQPLEHDAAQAASQPARHGLREATRLDKTVRDTGEFDADALTLHWKQGVLPALLADVARGLGLQQLEARVHNLLVYGPGQFFKPHQDTEKHPGMVATLVLVWPSAHIGGELRVRHGDAQAQFASQHLQATGLRWFAFYADCRHEVLPVSEGWRVVLTLDLVLPPPASLAGDTPDMPPEPVHPPLLAAMRALFETAQGPRSRPWVFLLEHEYTEHGLRWQRLKGEDRLHVQALRAAALALGLRMHLALAEIHETWSAVLQPGRRGRAETPEADELLDARMSLDFQVDANDLPLSGQALQVLRDDMESFSDTDDAFLVDEQYEGYMGNYGETLDFWYRRAALVLQTPEAAEASRFVADFDAALADALVLARQPGSGDMLARRVAHAVPALGFQRHQRGRKLFAAYAELACALPDAALARTLCESFAWPDLQPEDATALARLAGRWGADWVQDLLQQSWARLSPALSWHQQGGGVARLWPQALPAFLAACEHGGVSALLCTAMLDHTLALLVHADAALAMTAPALRQATLLPRLDAVCELAEALGPWSAKATSQQQRLLTHLRALPLAYPLRSLAPLWRVLPAEASAAPELHALREAVTDALRQALARPVQGADDHRLDALEIAWTCRCADCQQVIAWAGAATAKPLTLAMAESRRAHVQSRLQAAAAPIDARTLRQGSPYKLVLDKPPALHALLAQRRQDWQHALAALTALGAAP